MSFKKGVHPAGVVTILVNTGSTGPLVLTGTIDGVTAIRHHHSDSSPLPGKVDVAGDVIEEEEFLVLDVANAILPTGFPLTISQLTTDVAINMDYVIAILPVEI